MPRWDCIRAAIQVQAQRWLHERGGKLTARERRKLLREFSELGRDAVRYNLQVGGYGVAQRRDLAFEWLREQEAEANKMRRWTLYAAVIAAAVAVITLLATLGVIK
jgi:hypothetical protein